MTGEPDDDDEVDSADEEERTVVIERRRRGNDPAPGDDDDDATISLGRRAPSQDEDDRTISLGRRPAPAVEAPADDPVLRLLPSRARLGLGAGVVESYPARETILPPVPVVDDTIERDAARPDRGVLPSVARRSRRAGIRSLVVFGAACLVSVVGIVGVVTWFVSV